MSDTQGRADLGLSNQAGAPGAAAYADALHRWVSARWPDRRITGVGDFATPSEGLSNETVLFDARFDDGGVGVTERLVARIQAHGKPLAPLQSPRCQEPVEFEYLLHATVAAEGGLVAPVVGFETDRSYVGRPFYVMRHVAGRVPGVNPSFHVEGFMKDEAAPEQRRHVAERALAALARVHEIDWRAGELPSLFPNGAPDLAYQLDLYARDFEEQLGDRSFPLVERALAWLAAADPGAHRVGIVWGDARLGNVIVGRAYEPVALLDWENGFVGPCEADVGWWVVAERIYYDVLGIPRLPGYPAPEEHVACYERLSGRRVEHLRYWEVFAALRMAHGVLRLADRMQDAGALPPELGELGTQNPVTTILETFLPS